MTQHDYQQWYIAQSNLEHIAGMSELYRTPYVIQERVNPFDLHGLETIVIPELTQKVLNAHDNFCSPYVKAPTVMNGHYAVHLTTHVSLNLDVEYGFAGRTPNGQHLMRMRGLTSSLEERYAHYQDYVSWHRAAQFFIHRDLFPDIMKDISGCTDQHSVILTYLNMCNFDFHKVFPKSTSFLFNEAGLLHMLNENGLLTCSWDITENPMGTYLMRGAHSREPRLVIPPVPFFMDCKIARQVVERYDLCFRHYVPTFFSGGNVEYRRFVPHSMPSSVSYVLPPAEHLRYDGGVLAWKRASEFGTHLADKTLSVFAFRERTSVRNTRLLGESPYAP